MTVFHYKIPKQTNLEMKIKIWPWSCHSVCHKIDKVLATPCRFCCKILQCEGKIMFQTGSVIWYIKWKALHKWVGKATRCVFIPTLRNIFCLCLYYIGISSTLWWSISCNADGCFCSTMTVFMWMPVPTSKLLYVYYCAVYIYQRFQFGHIKLCDIGLDFIRYTSIL